MKNVVIKSLHDKNYLQEIKKKDSNNSMKSVMAEIDSVSAPVCEARMKPKHWISDQVIMFYIGYIKYQHDEYHGSPGKTAVLDSGFWQVLDAENRHSTSERTNDYASWVKNVRLWEDNGPEIVILPVCRNGHWVTLVALLSVDPSLFVLDSLGGSHTEAREAVLLNGS